MATKKMTEAQKAKLGVKTNSVSSGTEDLRKRRAAKRAANKALVRKPKAASKKKAPAKKAAAKPASKKKAPAKKTAAKKPAATKTAPAATAKAKDQAASNVVPIKPAAKKPEAVTTKPKAVTADEVGAAETLQLPLKLVAAALSVTPKDDARYMLNGVHIKQSADKLLRIVATDGHRLFVCNVLLEQKIAWAQKGVTIPRDHLDRIVKYLGRKTESIEIECGENSQHLRVNEIDGIARFKFKPVDGKFPAYQPIIDSAAHLFTDEREAMSITSIDGSYVKAAGALAGSLGATGVLPFLSCDGKTASVFAFAEVPEALLYIMPQKAREEVLPAATTKLFGKPAMQATLTELEAQIKKTRTNARTAKHKKFKDQFAAKADRLQSRADQLRAALSVKLAAPKPEADTAATSTPKPAADTSAPVSPSVH